MPDVLGNMGVRVSYHSFATAKVMLALGLLHADFSVFVPHSLVNRFGRARE